MWSYNFSDEIYHHGIKGQKWGRRRFQNSDGSLTPAGRSRYSTDVKGARAAVKEAKKAYNKSYNQAANKAIAGYSPFKKHRQANDERWNKAMNDAEKLNEAKAALKGAKNARKTERKYEKAGMAKGEAQFYRDKAKSDYEKHDQAAKVFDKTANRLESEGKYFRAEAARKTAASLRQRGMNVSEESLRNADYWVSRSEKLNKKASEYATKKNVGIGKKRVDSIIKSAEKKGYEYAKESDEIAREIETRNTLGEKGYNTYNKIRGK